MLKEFTDQETVAYLVKISAESQELITRLQELNNEAVQRQVLAFAKNQKKDIPKGVVDAVWHAHQALMEVDAWLDAIDVLIEWYEEEEENA